MDLLWPGALFLLGLIPLMIAGYIWMLRRRRPATVRYSSLSLIREAQPGHSRLRRHLPFALFTLAALSLVLALTRPAAIVSIPTDQTTIILAIDVSLSMRQNDIKPTRLEAAKSAAQSFIQRQKAQTQIGVVAFAGFAELIQPPTTDQEDLFAAVESLTLGRRTAIGSGILKSLDAIAEIDPSVAPSTKEGDPNPPPTPVPQGAYAPDIIVLLTDGVSNAGPTPIEAAQQAADRGVRVYTIGYGTERGGDFGFGGGQFQGQGGGPPGGDPLTFGNFRRGIDETTLKEVAAQTGAEYYAAASAHELENVYKNLPTYLISKHEVSEISFVFAGLGAVLAAVAVVLAMLWQPLP